MVALLETRMENHVGLRDEFNFDNFLEVPAQGRVGGIVFMWLTSTVTVARISQSEQEPHSITHVCPSHVSWIFSAIYASTKIDKR